jgi:S-formylglutathione hydrolase FrmB
MHGVKVNTIPAEYKRAAGKTKQGTITEESYSVKNYINSSRQLVTDQIISPGEAGRETVKGEGIIKPCNVYLPAGYDPLDKSTRYNVLYLLHGVGGDPYEWFRGSGMEDGNYILCNILDNLIANGEIAPVIVVFPNGRSAYDWMDRTFNSAGTNMLGFYYFDYELRYDLIPFIESKFNTYANIKNTTLAGIEYNRIYRAVAGLSMGGMQALNLMLGGFRCDSAEFVEGEHESKNGLAATVPAPGMEDLFAYIGAFSNAPTSSGGELLGVAIASKGYKLSLLYMTCGTADEISISSYEHSIEGLLDPAKDILGEFYQVVINDGVHDFNVWNNGAYNFIRLAFHQYKAQMKHKVVNVTLNT